MSHFIGIVVGEDYEAQLAPYDENLDTPRYVEYTKDQLIAKGRKEIAEYEAGNYAEYLKDPKKYEAGVSNPAHLEYLKNEFPKKLTWTDEQIYADQTRYYEKEDIGADGEVYSTYNPKSKWDWYSVGGRWAGFFKLKPGLRAGTDGSHGHHRAKDFAREGEEVPDLEADRADITRKGRVDFDAMLQEERDSAGERFDAIKKDPKDLNYMFSDRPNKGESRTAYINRTARLAPFCLIKDGEWYEKGEMGWWGMTRNEKNRDAWEEEFRKLMDEVPDDTILTAVDFHI